MSSPQSRPGDKDSRASVLFKKCLRRNQHGRGGSCTGNGETPGEKEAWKPDGIRSVSVQAEGPGFHAPILQLRRGLRRSGGALCAVGKALQGPQGTGEQEPVLAAWVHRIWGTDTKNPPQGPLGSTARSTPVPPLISHLGSCPLPSSHTS